MSTLKAEHAAALEFLRAFYPKGRWVLTSIDPDKKGIETRTFGPDSEDELVTWLARHNDECKWNVYFSEAEPMRPVKKKLERTDIKRVWYLHVDVDPRAGEDLADEQARALALCTTNLPDGIPDPTFVVFSGGGYQAHWRLQVPIDINGDLDAAEDAKLWNVQLERLFSADNCHNIDRIMRLPGTVNWPDAKKQKKGRKPAWAKVVVNEPSNVYALSEFTKAASVVTPAINDRPVAVNVTDQIARLDSVEALDEWGVPDRVKAIIVQGADVETPKEGDNSRSAWLFDVCCNLVRCGVPDDVIYAVITDPDFLISASVLDKGSKAHAYAVKNIARGKEQAIEPALRELNDTYFAVMELGGKFRVCHMKQTTLGRKALVAQSIGDFKNGQMNKFVQVGEGKNGNPTMKPRGGWWLDHPQRREFASVVFEPEHGTPDNVFNMWRGFAVDAAAGDASPFLDFVRDIICAADADHFDYVLKWIARAVQLPGRPGETAIVLRGGQGVGKSFFAKHFGKLFGQHFVHLGSSAHLTSNFNSHLRDCVLLFADEAFVANEKKHESIYKTLVTEESLPIEAKGVDVEFYRNCTHMILASNDRFPVPVPKDDRRSFVLDVADTKQRKSKYFGELAAWLNDGGYGILLSHLLTLDLTDFNHRNFPETSARADAKIGKLNDSELYVLGMLREAVSHAVGYEHGEVWAHSLTLAKEARTNMTEMGLALKAIIERKRFQKPVRLPGERDIKRTTVCVLKPLNEARQAFEEEHMVKVDWPEAQGWDGGEDDTSYPF